MFGRPSHAIASSVPIGRDLAGADVGSLKASVQVETGVSWGTDSAATWGTSRDSFIGLAGDFGSVKIGRLGRANQYVYDVNYFGDQVGDAGIFLENGTPGGRRDQQIQYSTPSMGGFTGTRSASPATAMAIPLVR